VTTTIWENPNCALNGFWEVDSDIIARFWKADWDLGSYQMVGKGQCEDSGGRLYSGWSSTSVRGDHCKAICDQSEECMGIELFDAGGCAARWDVEGTPEEPPSPHLTGFQEGDDAMGPVGGARGDGDRVCYKKSTGSQASGAADPFGGYWRMTMYARAGTWTLEETATKEAPIVASALRPEGLTHCSSSNALSATSPYLSDLSTWWGTREIHMWAGRSWSVPSWTKPADGAAWDPLQHLGAGRCSISQDMQVLPGKRTSVEHALWGMRDCSDTGFRRLSPEVVPLDEAGWNQVVADKFYFGVEIFLLRYTASRHRKVVDQECFTNIVKFIWRTLEQTPFPSLAGRVVHSRCTAWA